MTILLKEKILNIKTLRNFTICKIVLYIIFVFITASCSTKNEQIIYNESIKSDYYLAQYNKAKGDDKLTWQLITIRALLNESDTQKAQFLLNTINNELNISQQNEISLLKQELALKNDKLVDISVPNFNLLSDEQKIRFYRLKIYFDGKKNNLNDQIRNYVELQKYGSQIQKEQVTNETWEFLLSLPQTAINDIYVYTNERELQGWLNLIYTYNTVRFDENNNLKDLTNEDSKNKINVVIDEWKTQYSDHPATKTLLTKILGVEDNSSDATKIKKVALLLPLSGHSKTFGDAVKYGYLEAKNFYSNELNQQVIVYDTNAQSVKKIIQQAKKQNVNLIVGPLLKQDVISLIKENKDLPILSLNHISNIDLEKNKSIAPQCFFSLSPEDEAVQTALKMFKQGKKNPLLIVQNNELGQRIVNSFIKEWELLSPEENKVYVQFFESQSSLRKLMNQGIGFELEGTLVNDNSLLQKNIDNQANNLANLNSSIGITDSDVITKSNKSNRIPIEDKIFDVSINNQTLTSINQLPTFDSIYINASYNELSLIKAMLDMPSNKKVLNEQGKQLKVIKKIPSLYASSRSHVSNATKDFNHDVDGLIFTEIPLLTEKKSLINTLPNYIKNDFSLVRLYALGVDALRLANHYEELISDKTITFDGLTGNLSISADCQITRSLNWQKYSNGNLVSE